MKGYNPTKIPADWDSLSELACSTIKLTRVNSSVSMLSKCHLGSSTLLNDCERAIASWISCCRVAADELVSTKQIITESQIADRLIGGLVDQSWSAIKNTIINSPIEVSLDDAIAALQAHECHHHLADSSCFHCIPDSFGDIVLAKVKGHPAWPARIVDPYASPMNLRDEQKINQKNIHLVKFFKTADYNWVEAKEFDSDLKAAYQLALAPEDCEAEIEVSQISIDEEQQASELNDLEPASPKKQKSVDARPADTIAEASSIPESPVVAPVLENSGEKLEEPVVPVGGESIVRNWRHQLQRSFLNKTALTEKRMPEIDDIFKEIEQLEMKIEWLNEVTTDGK
ncbi:hypothetical protein PCANC_21385 [Puccinia coronata f. sp. avenae]|uniref:PWWP domain-containing protein n=1 Tax=Puccinia coronata f. sp. avenae TaxID=200324 RepID=A0A2N5UBY1_9BASI|nr:hypothetical protein PCANC_21385 [Puccinia coronata f. sp. avenae]